MNMISVSKLIVAVFCLMMLPNHGYALTPGQVFEKVKGEVFVVMTLDKQGKIKKQGSGVLISPGRVATNYHVVKGGVSYQVGQGKQMVSASIYAFDVGKDICLLDVNGIFTTPAQIGKATDLKVGDPVYAVGAPQGLELSLSDGVVAQLRGEPPSIIQTTAAISPGSSGGGLFDGEGRLVGLTTLYLKDGQNLNFAMPVEWISEIRPSRQQTIDGANLRDNDPIIEGELHPGRKKNINGDSKKDWLKRSVELEKKKNWQGMVDWGRKWTKSEPESATAWLILGEGYYKLDRYNDAIKAFRQGLHINPDDANAWYFLGRSYYKLDRYNDAIEAYRQEVRINPNNSNGWLSLGMAYSGLKSYHGAIEAYRQVVRINPNDSDAWDLVGTAYSRLKRYNDAFEAYRQVLRINPNNSDGWLSIGECYYYLNRYNDAIEAYRQALRINPDNANAWYSLACIYGESGNRTSALAAARELRRLDPAKADDLSNLFNLLPR